MTATKEWCAGKCSECGRETEVRDFSIYGRGVLCFDCYFGSPPAEPESDPATRKPITKPINTGSRDTGTPYLTTVGVVALTIIATVLLLSLYTYFSTPTYFRVQTDILFIPFLSLAGSFVIGTIAAMFAANAFTEYKVGFFAAFGAHSLIYLNSTVLTALVAYGVSRQPIFIVPTGIAIFILLAVSHFTLLLGLPWRKGLLAGSIYLLLPLVSALVVWLVVSVLKSMGLIEPFP